MRRPRFRKNDLDMFMTSQNLSFYLTPSKSPKCLSKRREKSRTLWEQPKTSKTEVSYPFSFEVHRKTISIMVLISSKKKETPHAIILELKKLSKRKPNKGNILKFFPSLKKCFERIGGFLKPAPCIPWLPFRGNAQPCDREIRVS